LIKYKNQLKKNLFIGNESKMPIGVIDVQLEMFPKPTKILGQEVLTAQLNMERSRQSEKERLFLVYAKQWWKEYLQIRPANQERLVKLFAQVFRQV
jgi:centrosomal protein CEP76